MGHRCASTTREGPPPAAPWYDRPVSRRAVTTAGLVAPLAALLAGCGSTGATGPRTLRVLDTYTNDPDRTIIGGALAAAAAEVGVTLERVSVAGDSLIQRVLQQGSSGTLPDILMLDNPDLQQIASTTALRPFDALGIPTDGYTDGVTAAGTYEGRVYGLAPTVNTVALFYDVPALEAAGIEPPTTWSALREAAAALTRGDRYGIAFCGNATYEGTWQYLPFFWSNGADERDIASPEAAGALDLLAGLVRQGHASTSVLNWSQADVKDQFVAGRAAMMVNGPWQIPELSGVEGLEYDVVTLPTRDPATQAAVAPLGGEVWTVPATGDRAKERLAAQVLTRFLADDSILSMAEQRFTVPGRHALTDAFLERRPEMAAFADLLGDARARTAQLGPDWPATATALYTAVQLALSGQVSAADALREAGEYA
ncbi:sugar ABC transporter substrate-binding protein [Krasilnikoviella flava]|uniref:Carbohydrate ABC transporter substrate-binding protein, CUT1 family n=1 Tax=Krasilnikoviella flava TaxID=526729 RepID=A0A1T5I734_9MICO|nr:extracellular solute-binding protein [Krasilnikoviella flava]SKC34823.1 carbohydrate ABC transporter substrate-binding protein, CUT1 family [Krasilnikoviella flava]